MQLSIVPRRAMKFISSALLALTPLIPLCRAQAQPSSNKPIVFLIVIENKNAVGRGGVYGSAEAPYINKTLFPMAAVANNYFNPPGNHPSLPNYLWMEAGQNFGVHDDGPPSQHHQSTHAHLTTLLTQCRSSLARLCGIYLWECLPTDFGKWRAVSNEAPSICLLH